MSRYNTQFFGESGLRLSEQHVANRLAGGHASDRDADRIVDSRCAHFATSARSEPPRLKIPVKNFLADEHS